MADKKSVFEKIQERKDAGKLPIKKPAPKKEESPKDSANRILIANVNAYLMADEQEKNAKKLKDDLKEKIFKKLDEDGEETGKGHKVIETDLFTITKERRASLKIADDAAQTFADKGLNEFIDVTFIVSGKHKQAIEQAISQILGGSEIYQEKIDVTAEEIERALLNNNITQEEFKQLCEEKESFSLKVKKR